MNNNSKTIQKQVLNRTLVALVAILVLFGILAGRLAYLQLINYAELRNKVLQQYSSTIVLPASRGAIYDRNMKVLAMSETVETVFISPKGIKDAISKQEKSETLKESEKVDYKNLIADNLSSILGVDKSMILARMEKTGSQYEVIKKEVEEETANKVRKFIIDNNLSTMVNLEESSKRYYQYNDLASHVLGINGTDGGLMGLEKYYDDELSGTDGRIVKAKNAGGYDMPYKYETYVEAQNGSNLVTTIDVNIQSIIEKYLEKVYNDQQAKNRVAAAIMDVNTGEVLGSAVYPDFNLNDPYTLTGEFLYEYDAFVEAGVSIKTDPETGEEITKPLTEEEINKKKSDLLYKMWNNKVVSEIYEPGSTFKIVTTAIAMEEGIAGLNNDYTCVGSISVDGVNIGCHKAGGHGHQTFAETLQNSCNPAFVSLGLRIGKESFMRYFEEFGYLDLTGCDMVGESSTYYYGTNNSQFGRVELATYSFGQSFKTSILQQLRATSVVANGGYLVTPHLAKYLTDDNGNITYTFEYETDRQVISSEVSDSIVDILYGGINTGSTKNAAVEGYSIAAKTGTSQKLDIRDKDVYVSSCVAFAPAEDPQIAIIVVVDEPSVHDFYGGLVAAPVVSSILSEVLPYLEIPRNGEVEHKTITVTKMIGKTLDEAKKDLATLGLEYRVVGGGDKVVDQMPLSGSVLTEGGKVILYTEYEEEHKTVVVPNVKGYRAQDALTVLYGKGLNVRVTGAYSSSITGTPMVVIQDIEAGTEVPEGTVITVEFRYSENVYG